MAKQKIVVKVTMKNHKSPRKALQIVVSVSRVVDSVTLVDKQQIVVIGERIDPAHLTCLLRKRVGHAELVSVGPVEEKKPPKPPSTTTTATATSQKEPKQTVWCECVCREHHCWQAWPVQVVHEVPSNTCSIL